MIKNRHRATGYYYNWRNLSQLPRNIQQIFWSIGDFIERGKYGWAKSDLWSFDTYLSHIIIDGLTELKTRSLGIPIDDEIKNEEDWNNVLDEIIYGFNESIIWEERFFDKYPDFELGELPPWSIEDYKKESEDVEKSFKKSKELFIKWFSSFWV